MNLASFRNAASWVVISLALGCPGSARFVCQLAIQPILLACFDGIVEVFVEGVLLCELHTSSPILEFLVLHCGYVFPEWLLAATLFHVKCVAS